MVPCFVTSSRTVDMSRSVCRTLLGMYRGAFTIVRNTLFWKRCSIVILDLEAMPQRGIPYVHMGRNIYSKIWVKSKSKHNSVFCSFIQADNMFRPLF